MAEWSNAVASKAIISGNRDRGFESPSLLTTLVPSFVRQAFFLKEDNFEKKVNCKMEIV